MERPGDVEEFGEMAQATMDFAVHVVRVFMLLLYVSLATSITFTCLVGQTVR